MKQDLFPPLDENRPGFYDIEIYEEALERYPSIVDLIERKAEENQDKVWLEFQDGRTFTYKGINEQATRLASGLMGRGVKKGDHVAIFSLNSPEWVLAYFAILKLGAVPVTVNTGFIKDPLCYNLTSADATYVVVDTRLLSRFRSIESEIPFVKHVFLTDKTGTGDEDLLSLPFSYFEDLFEEPLKPLPKVDSKGMDTCTMILTSGTTGPSKVVADTNAQFVCSALFLVDEGGITSESVVYNYLPLFHIMALDLAMLASMLANAKMVLVETFDPDIFWQHVQKYGISHFHAVGPILEMLFKCPESDLEKNHPTLTSMSYCSKEIWNMAKERFNISITGGYGSTEVGIPTGAPNNLHRASKNPPGACGLVGPHVEVRIMDESGLLLPPGKTGEIVVRPKLPWTIFSEYYGMPEATAQAFKGLWFHTGDAGYFDDEGYLYFVDRLKDSIRRKGENISSHEVEQILLKHPGIAEVIVIPAPSEVGDDEVMAVVTKADGSELTSRDIVKYSKENMPHFWVPRYIRFVETLPRTQTGKIEKFKMKREGITSDTYDRKNN